jgi:hypothetical protein
MVLGLSFHHLLYSQAIVAIIFLQKIAFWLGPHVDPRLISKSYKAISRLSSTQDYVAAVFRPTGCFILFRTTLILNRWAANSR